jgi:ElaB/YqjD/DUF883 family membrane-anchored ribosome-binding protein
MPAKSEKSPDTDAGPSLEAQLEALRAEIEALAATVSSLGRDKIAEIQAKAEAVAGDMAGSARAALGEVRRETEKLEEQMKQQVQEKPLQSLLVAFGLGVIVSLILRR